MSEQGGSVEKYALAIVGAVVGLVVVGVIGLGVSKASKPRRPMGAPIASIIPAAPGGPERIEFDDGKDGLPDNAREALGRVAETARRSNFTMVQITAFHDAEPRNGNTAVLAGKRAEAVRHALEANGVPPAQMLVTQPVSVPGGTDPHIARGVELEVH